MGPCRHPGDLHRSDRPCRWGERLADSRSGVAGGGGGGGAGGGGGGGGGGGDWGGTVPAALAAGGRFSGARPVHQRGRRGEPRRGLAFEHRPRRLTSRERQKLCNKSLAWGEEVC